jgi:DegV family protein with EDD domain
MNEVVEQLNAYIPKVRSQFAIETMDYLHKGGRCSGVVYFIGKGLKIKPIIRVVDGKMVVYKKPIGKMVNALNKLIEIFLEDLPNMDLSCVMVTHSLGDESCKYLKEKLKEHIDPSIIMETNAGATISTHCGKGTIGILYALK